MEEPQQQPRLYSELASWWPVLSAPEDYAEEAAGYRRIIESLSRIPVREVLELGSGGGSNASHLKAVFQMTLVDLSPGMLAVSRLLNPECEHIQGDMRTVRLGRRFDAVFIHDAVCYMITLEDLRRAAETAYIHCKPGGAALFVPDYVRETFTPHTDHGGHDRGGRSMRYLEWTYDPDPADSTIVTDFAYLLRDERGEVLCEHDRHVTGLFSREEWLGALRSAGFEPQAVEQPGEADGSQGVIFAGRA
jgi:SAM-dependent methyltransferase